MDNFEWLEDSHSGETARFVTEQNERTQQFFGPHNDTRRQLREALTDVYNYARYGCPAVHGGRVYYSKNDGLQNQSVVYDVASIDADETEAAVFFDPNSLSDDGTVALKTSSFSLDGSRWAYSVSERGSDWETVRVRDVAARTDMPSEELRWVKFSGLSWTHDGRGFFYSRYPEPDLAGRSAGTEAAANEMHAVFYHRLGTPQDADVPVFRTPDHPDWLHGAHVTGDGEYVVVTSHEGCLPANHVRVAAVEEGGLGEMRDVVTTMDASFEYVWNSGSRFFFVTNLDAPRKRIVAADLAQEGDVTWEEVLAQHPSDVLETAVAIPGARALVVRTHDVCDQLLVISLADGEVLTELPLPGPGSIAGLSARHDRYDVFFKFTSFLDAGTTFHLRLPDDATATLPSPRLFRRALVPGVDLDELVTEQVFYTSRDGTRIPMFLVHRRALERDGRNAVYLYGYGGFNISLGPSFSPFRLILLARLGVVLAVPNLRGGGEYGEDWHQAGIRDRKQNVFDDFFAAAEFLVAERFTEHRRIAICGGSNGGLLVGAAITQRPDLFGCAVAQVGVFDMLRFHRFTIGRAWCSDYGNPDDPDDRAFLLRYSPLHNVRPDRPVPPTLLTTGDHDDRVVPLHSFKFAATLQHALPSNPGPILLRVETKTGHGAGRPTSKIIDEVADIYTFISISLGLSLS